MGKLLHKLLHGIVPSWLYAVFKRPHASSRKLLCFRLRHGIHLMSNKSFSPTSPSSSSSPSTTELVSLLMDVDQNTYYYSQSEDEEQHPIAGTNKHTSSISIRSEFQDEDNDRDAYHHNADCRLSASHDDCTKENAGICAPLAAATIVKGSLHKDKHEPPMAVNMEFTHATSAAGIILPIQHDDDHQNHHQQQQVMRAMKGCQYDDGTQDDKHHHHRQHCIQDEKHHLHDTSVDYQHPQPHPSGSKRKGFEDDVGEDNRDGHCSVRTRPCSKRRKGANVRCELPESLCEMVGNGSAVVEYSYQDPQLAFGESMLEMVLCNGLWGDVGKLEFLLHCYLALNDPHLHHAIHASFLQVMKHLSPAY